MTSMLLQQPDVLVAKGAGESAGRFSLGKWKQTSKLFPAFPL